MERTSPDLEAAELRSLVALFEQRHFGRAAEGLGISQPALTKRLQRLEQKVGGLLVSRGYRDVRLTEPGLVLLEQARGLLRSGELALEVSRQALSGGAGFLRIGFGVASIAQTLPDILLRFRRSHPRVQVVMRDMSSSAQLQALRSEEIEIGFVRMPVTDPAIDVAPRSITSDSSRRWAPVLSGATGKASRPSPRSRSWSAPAPSRRATTTTSSPSAEPPASRPAS